ncbi:hypothetical protein UFOVP836_16 [uncultured Caudovirales phage]|uniref:Uncharacterized protein n=1 Tax=uncultured Caudovirales phage TaxID=2100421 RepID=A0A6J5P525_9CAUD|nr:hypothetical protein UFOVP836_16 [uncultured Caudovirales phage]
MARVTRAEREMEQLLQLAGLRDDLRKITAERDQLRAEVERVRGEIGDWKDHLAIEVERSAAAESAVAGLRQALEGLHWWFDEDHELEREAVRVQREAAGVRWTSDQWIAAVLDAMEKEGKS